MDHLPAGARVIGQVLDSLVLVLAMILNPRGQVG